MEKNIAQNMAQNQIWLKPKPTHIDEYFEDFLMYIKSPGTTSDALYKESLRLLNERVAILIGEREATPAYRMPKADDALQFNVRLCGAWLLVNADADADERKEVLLILFNSLIQLAMQSKKKDLSMEMLAYKKLPELLGIAISLGSHDLPALPFGWTEILDFKLDIFAARLLAIKINQNADNCYDGHGSLIAKDGLIEIASCPKSAYDKSFVKHKLNNTDFLPEFGFKLSNDKGLQIKESQKNDVSAIERFVNDFVALMQAAKKEAKPARLLDYANGDVVPVEVKEVYSNKITVETIDPEYNKLRYPLAFDSNLKMFSKTMYPIEMWAKVLKVGDRFNARFNEGTRIFSIEDAFINYIHEQAPIGDGYDSHNNLPPDGRLERREFWTCKGFMVYVDLTEEESAELDEHGGYAGIEVTEYGIGSFRGCVYGVICDYDVENQDISRESYCPDMLADFIESISDVKISETKETAVISPSFIKEYCTTMNMLQSREVNPMLRYRILSVMRMLCTLISDDADNQYCEYLMQYLKTLIIFAQADSDEGELVKPIEIPKDLSDEDSVVNGVDILEILSYFAKDYDKINDKLDEYLDKGNETLSKTASLVQSYNRLIGLLEPKTLKGIKKEILNLLSVVTDGDSQLDLSNEVEGLFGMEDDMKEFKQSFFEAPRNAKEQDQFLNIFRGICAMMNNRGGVLYLGVDDRGNPVGLKHDLEILAKQYKAAPTLDAYMLHINRLGGDWFGEKNWKYVSMKPNAEYNIVIIHIETPYDLVELKDGSAYLRKNNASAPILDEETKDDIRRRRLANLRKSDDKIINMQDAINKQRKARLMGYRSSNSGTIRNRVVEPFHIESNEYAYCYEAETDKVKSFRISRADKVVVLDEPWENKSKHKKLNVDPFHMTGNTKVDIKLELKLQAKNAFEENFSGIGQYIKQTTKETWMLDTFSYNLNSLAMFYLSYARSIKIIEAPGLQEAIVAYVKEHIPFLLKK